MKHWLKELVASGYDESRIRGLIRKLVWNWGHGHTVQWRGRLHCVSASGKQYYTQMPAEPNFSDFFAHRKAIASAINQAVAQRGDQYDPNRPQTLFEEKQQLRASRRQELERLERFKRASEQQELKEQRMLEERRAAWRQYMRDVYGQE